MEAAQGLTLKNILIQAIKDRASDIHFSVGNVPIFRVNDKLVSGDSFEPVTADSMTEMSEAVLSPEQRDKLKQFKELILTYSFDKNLRFKINFFYQRGMLSASFRYIPSQVRSLSELGLAEGASSLVNIKKGLIVIAGPFGSGRSTTAAALIEEINRTRKEYIITVEKHPEHLFSNRESIIEQREVGVDANSFLGALEYFQEENGDVLFIEEMNDKEVIPAILEIAGGSSLVISCISAESARKAITRILDSFQSFDQERIRDLLSTSLKAVWCQKLVPSLAGGLVPAYELLKINDSAAAMIMDGTTSQLDNLIRTSRREEMVSLEQTLAAMVKSGKIASDKAYENANDKNTLDNALK
jgi:twitching motility protein PilT